MSGTQEKSKVDTPWQLWMIGVFALLWSSMGALDYVMTQTRNESYMSNFTLEQLEFFMVYRPGRSLPGSSQYGVGFLAQYCY